MEAVTPMEIGLVIWAEPTADATLQQVADFGLSNIQLGIPPSIDCAAAVYDWKAALASSSVAITSAVCCYEGEDYSDLAHVHDTVGFTNEKYRAERIARTKEIADFAANFNIGAVSCHIGFIPADSSDPLYRELLDVACTLCDAAAANGQNFVLETGQESAEVLLRFIADSERSNLKINFDPANLVMYGFSDPLEALSLVRQHVISIHCKDGIGPSGPGQLGSERTLGEGQVDFPGFLNLLQQIGYKGPLTIEREAPDAETRKRDVRTAIVRLKEWKALLKQ